MVFQPLDSPIATDVLTATCLIASDMDGTLTLDNKFTPAVLQAFQALEQMGIPLLIVTGRSAGWVSGLAHYLPVAGAIAENGGLFYTYPQESPRLLTPIPDLSSHRQKLADVFRQLQAQFPQLQESGDNRFRLTDWTFDVQGLSPADLATMAEFCHRQGWSFTYSTVQCHIKPAGQDKAVGLQQVLHHYFPQLSATQVLTVGDSPNDESLFDPAHFPHSLGVANLATYRDRLTHLPVYLTQAAEGLGFCELVQMVQHCRQS